MSWDAADLIFDVHPKNSSTAMQAVKYFASLTSVKIPSFSIATYCELRLVFVSKKLSNMAVSVSTAFKVGLCDDYEQKN